MKFVPHSGGNNRQSFCIQQMIDSIDNPHRQTQRYIGKCADISVHDPGEKKRRDYCTQGHINTDNV